MASRCKYNRPLREAPPPPPPPPPYKYIVHDPPARAETDDVVRRVGPVGPRAVVRGRSVGPRVGVGRQSVGRESVGPRAGVGRRSVGPRAGVGRRSVDPRAGVHRDSVGPRADVRRQSVGGESVGPRADVGRQSVGRMSVGPRAGVGRQSVGPRAGVHRDSVGPRADVRGRSVSPHRPAACAATKPEDHKFELQSSGSTQQQLFRCDGCKQQGSGPRYTCRDDGCNYLLHTECMPPKETEIYGFFGDRKYQFFRKPQEKRGCRACGKDILGFNYQSVDGTWHLHPCCAKLPMKLSVQETLFELRDKMKGECIWCREKKAKARGTGGVPGWGYASRHAGYHFHVYCLMEMFHTNASRKDFNMELSEIKLEQLAKKSERKWFGGKIGIFSNIVEVLVNLIASILLGDASLLVVPTVVKLLKG